MALIFDTNALSAFADGDAGLRQIIETETDLGVPVIVLGEYLFGIRRSRHHSRYQDWLEQNRRIFLLLPIEAETAYAYSEVRSELKAAGHPIPSNDLWIAALARQHRFPIVSRDRHFAAVRGVHVLAW